MTMHMETGPGPELDKLSVSGQNTPGLRARITLIQNGTDGTIITENYAEGNTTVQVSHNFTDETTYPKGTYKVELYLTDTATKPVAEGELIIVERPVNMVFFHQDHLGTPRLITDEDGQTVSTHDYLAYGEEITTADFQTNRMKFTGHERDPETGLDYMLARYYSAGNGRFLQVDPGKDYDQNDPMSYNLYGYVRGNPVMAVDKTGEMYIRVELITGGNSETFEHQGQRIQTTYKPFGKSNWWGTPQTVAYHVEFDTLPGRLNWMGDNGKTIFDIVKNTKKFGTWISTLLVAAKFARREYGSMNGTINTDDFCPHLLPADQIMELEARIQRAAANLFDFCGNIPSDSIKKFQAVINAEIRKFVASLQLNNQRRQFVTDTLLRAYDLSNLLPLARGEELVFRFDNDVMVFRDENGHLHM